MKAWERGKYCPARNNTYKPAPHHVANTPFNKHGVQRCAFCHKALLMKDDLWYLRWVIQEWP